MKQEPLYIVHISIHGLVRGDNIELGRDADTGGQIKYVVELARELGKSPDVGRVDLFTRQIFDPKVSSDYAQTEEQLSDKAHIVRLPCGPRRYLHKESLWPHLESFIDQALQHFRRLQRLPDVIHGHYADAGYVGAMLANVLEVPFVFTGHSLGLVKQERLLEKGLTEAQIDERYRIKRRIEAEEVALNSASLVITSTHQEVQEQYAQYDNYVPERMVVIPPGVDLSRFCTTSKQAASAQLQQELNRFLQQPEKPMILALSRADERKNINGLIKAYGENPALQEAANLVLVAGNRDVISDMEKGTRQVLKNILLDIDRYDLYGKVAYPKHHQSEDVPEFYRLAAQTGGVFVNPALTEPFGLTLIEAAASGLPIVATHDGGPCDIVQNCQNGVLVDPLDSKAMGEAILGILQDKQQWQQCSEQGLTGVREHYSWSQHAGHYLERVQQEIELHKPYAAGFRFTRKLPVSNRIIITDIDNTLIGDPKGLAELLEYLRAQGDVFSFGIATGRRIDSAQEVLEEWGVPTPDVLVSSVGSEIYYGPKIIHDNGWSKHINYRWEPNRLRDALSHIKGLELQPMIDQRPFKLSYFVDPSIAPPQAELVTYLRKNHFLVNAIYSHQQFLDLLPIRASKGLAVRYLAFRWGLPLEHFIVAGDSGNDEEMLKGDTLGIVVGNYSEELEKLRGSPKIYFAEGQCAKGILEGIQHFGFLESQLRNVA